MIKIEKDKPIIGKGKYKEYIETMLSMKKDDSFLTNDYKVVDAVRGYGWRKGVFNVAFREVEKVYHRNRRLKEVIYRVWKL